MGLPGQGEQQGVGGGDPQGECRERNREEYSRFAEPYAISCPHCTSRLKLWPAKGAPFLCDDWAPSTGKNCRSRGREIPSNGENRLNCFVCDYDLCVDCVNKRGAVKISGIFKDDIDQPPSYFEATKNDYSIK